MSDSGQSWSDGLGALITEPLKHLFPSAFVLFTSQ